MKKITCIIVAILLLLLCGCVGSTISNIDVRIFGEIQECKKFEELAGPNVTIELLDTPTADSYLYDLVYIDFYGFEYRSTDINFELYAYNFADSEDANAYFYNVTGKNNTFEKNFSDSSGMLSYRRIALSGNKVYCAYTTPSEADRMIEIINGVFSQELFYSE